MALTGSDLDQLRKELNQVLSRYGETKGIQFKLGNISYGSSYFNVKLSAFLADEDNDGKRDMFKMNCGKFGIPADWYGKVVVLDGMQYKITEVAPRARKYPVILAPVNSTVAGGKKAPVEYIRRKIAEAGGIA